MSSGFVSGGTTDQPIERDDAWLEAQKEIEANRRRKEEASRQQDGKTLYEVLQQNKAAKQDAFEESIRLKNQFRNLDEDEVEFLDSVLESTRAKEEAVKKETTEQLDLFRRQQEEADRVIVGQDDNAADMATAKAGSPLGEESEWAVSARKRKRVKEKVMPKGFKLRKSSTGDQVAIGTPVVESVTNHEPLPSVPSSSVSDTTKTKQIPQTRQPGEHHPAPGQAKNPTPPKVASTIIGASGNLNGLGLAGYSSDED